MTHDRHSQPRDVRQIVCPDIVLNRPVHHPSEGMPIGNGRMGTMMWTAPGSIEFQINRVDVFAVNRHAGGAHFPGGTDYCGGCARLSIVVGGEPFRAETGFEQRLSLTEARCDVQGEGVRSVSWVAANDDALVVTVTDERKSPRPIEVTLAMWREPEVRTGEHTAAYSFREEADRVAVVQTFREADHFCASAVAIASPGNDTQIVKVDTRCRVLRLAAARGSRTVLAVSAASLDTGADVCSLVDEILAKLASPAALAEAEEQHARWWEAFWGRTFVRIKSPGERGEQAARDRELFLYHMASSSRGAYPPKWNGSIFLTSGDARAWGAQFWLWTTELLYWPLHAADASDLTEPFFEMYRRQLPALDIAARQRWRAAGIFLPETTPFDGPKALSDDEANEYRDHFLGEPHTDDISAGLAASISYDWHLSTLTSETARNHHGYSWISHLASSAAELAVHAWWRYRHTGDIGWLRSHAYPLLRGVVEFYRSLARRGEDGHWHLHGTNAHEDFWGVTDSIMDLAAIRGTVPLAIRAATLLDVDADLREQWQAFLDNLAPYPMGSDPRARTLAGGALADVAWAAGYKGAVDGSHNSEDVQLSPIFPFEDWTLETRSAAMDAVARRTLALVPRHRRVLAGDTLNTAVRSPIAAVRAGMGAALPALLAHYRAAFQALPNGFSPFEGESAHSIEHLGLLTMILQEALLQSVSPHPGKPDIINIFPAWPKIWDASFRLLARGGFVVSATMRSGRIGPVEVKSRLGEECRVRNPWPNPCHVETDDGRRRKDASVIEGVIRFPTQPGGCYRLFSSVPEDDNNSDRGIAEPAGAGDA
jgi:hypothetical protein